MMLCKLSFKNAKKSIKDYAIYFFTLILGVAIFYIFNSIDAQTAMMDLTNSKKDIIKLMISMLSAVSVFVSFILGFLILYASRFLIRRRKKEFGLYMTLGMSKGKISKILLLETILIGIISLFVGLLFGIVLSQAMSVFVANMFEADMTNFSFTFSSSAMIKTMIYFAVIYLIVMIFNTIVINRCKLIELLHADKLTENIKMKNPYLCILIFIIASVILGIAYYLVTGGIAYLDTANKILIPITLGCIGTFFIFWSISGLLLKLVMSIKKVYYKNLNCFTLRQISSKVNTTVFSMSVICIMLFITICTLSSALSLKNSLNANLKELVPMDMELTKTSNDSSIMKQMIKQKENITSYIKNTYEFSWYQDDNLTLKETLGEEFEEIQEEFKFFRISIENIIRISDYNKLAKLYNQKTYTLEPNEYMIIADYENMVNIRNKALKKHTPIIINHKQYVPKFDECKKGFVQMNANHANTGIIIVPDNAVENNMKYIDFFVANYNGTTKEEKQEIESIVMDIYKKIRTEEQYETLSINTKIDIYEASIGLGALVTFIGMYLGIIFLITSAAILALKELSDSTDNKKRYTILRKLGADEKLINKSLYKQIAIFFLFPLALAIIHSIFGIYFANYILEVFGNDKLLISIIMAAIFLLIIYGGYFIITYYCSKNIIKEK